MENYKIENLYKYYLKNYDSPMVSKYSLMEFISDLYRELQKR